MVIRLQSRLAAGLPEAAQDAQLAECPAPPWDAPEASWAHQRAFTLIEFILVMGLLAVVIALSAPSLSNFFRGRKLESEARRFVSVTRYGQSRAVAEGLAKGERVDFRGFGAFAGRESAARAGRNPRTGETIQIAARKTPTFKVGKELRDKVNPTT